MTLFITNIKANLPVLLKSEDNQSKPVNEDSHVKNVDGQLI